MHIETILPNDYKNNRQTEIKFEETVCDVRLVLLSIAAIEIVNIYADIVNMYFIVDNSYK
ncbi:MAG: hypothetical protein K0R54_4748 [Clostridiaceae bacterium]|nr:hypothetical protein [Clostridiaceae bacterium]